MIETDNSQNSNELKDKLLEQLASIVSQLKDITEFNNRELKAISVLSMNPFMRRFFTSDKSKNLDYVDNKKHLKRKYEKTLLKTITKISESLSQSYDDSKFINFFSRDKRG